MSNPTPDRKALEELWRLRLDDARLRVEFARQHLKQVAHDFPLKELSDSDGYFAYRGAIRSENSALLEYRRVLRCYRDLVVTGVVPDEAAWHKDRAAGAGQSE